MSRIIIAVAGLGIVGAATLWAQSTASQSQGEEKTIQKLEARINALEDKVALLEKKQTVTYVSYPVAAQNAAPAERPPTADSVPLEFNGQTFYYVPLKAER